METVSPPNPRALLIDDSSATRRSLATALAAANVEVVGVAATIASALTRIEQLSPAVVISKCEVGEPISQLLRSLKQAGRDVPVVLFDAGLEAGSPRALDALLAGATACVSRPASPDALPGAIAEKLLPVLRRLCESQSKSPASPATSLTTNSLPIRETSAIATRPREEPPLVVAVASSTGGPDALAVVLGGLPVDFAVPILIVQHMPSGFTSSFANRLATLTRRRVREGTDGALLRDADIWIAPGGRHLLVAGKRDDVQLRVSHDPPENSCRPSADVLFRAVAATCGPRALGVVLTGMGQDGLEGCRALRAAGGQVVVQDQATSVVGSMPRAVAEAKLAHAVLPLQELAFEIARRCRGANR